MPNRPTTCLKIDKIHNINKSIQFCAVLFKEGVKGGAEIIGESVPELLVGVLYNALIITTCGIENLQCWELRILDYYYSGAEIRMIFLGSNQLF